MPGVSDVEHQERARALLALVVHEAGGGEWFVQTHDTGGLLVLTGYRFWTRPVTCCRPPSHSGSKSYPLLTVTGVPFGYCRSACSQPRRPNALICRVDGGYARPDLPQIRTFALIPSGHDTVRVARRIDASSPPSPKRPRRVPGGLLHLIFESHLVPTEDGPGLVCAQPASIWAYLSPSGSRISIGARRLRGRAIRKRHDATVPAESRPLCNDQSTGAPCSIGWRYCWHALSSGGPSRC